MIPMRVLQLRTVYWALQYQNRMAKDEVIRLGNAYGLQFDLKMQHLANVKFPKNGVDD